MAKEAIRGGATVQHQRLKFGWPYGSHFYLCAHSELELAAVRDREQRAEAEMGPHREHCSVPGSGCAVLKLTLEGTETAFRKLCNCYTSCVLMRIQ
jgi:hypothetical protein